KACLYSLLLCLFFLVFGTFILRLFGVPLAMVRVVGGIILMRIGFSLFMPQKSGADFGLSGAGDANIAFVPLAMPLMCGPGAIATIIGMTATVRRSSTEVLSFIAIVAAIFATVFVTYLCLANARKLTERFGPMGIDAATRIVGFFVSAIGVGLDRRPAVGQYRRRPGAGAFRRRGHGEPHDRPLTATRRGRDRPQYGVCLQRQAARREDDRARVERPLCAGGQRSARRKPDARQRAAHRRRNGQSSLGRAVQQAARRSLRHAGRNRRPPGERAERPARRRRGATGRTSS